VIGTGDLTLGGIAALAAVVGVAVLVGIWTATHTSASPRLLSCCTGAITGLMAGMIAFEIMPSLRFALSRALFTFVGIASGFVLAAIINVWVQSRLPERHSFEEVEMSAFILAVIMDDIVEGLILGLASVLSVRLLLFSTSAFLSKNLLEGFAEGTVLRWEGKGTRGIWAGGIAAAFTPAVIAPVAGGLVAALGLEDTARQWILPIAAGALIYVSAFELARQLEWNSTQKISAAICCATTAAISFIVR
jgi:zinc transporter ZupT